MTMTTSTLQAAAPTDIWRKPPSLDVSNAPTSTTKLHSKDFHKARVTISAQWSRLYDQGGIYVSFPLYVGSNNAKRCWLKTGIEFYNNRPNLSTVAAREWADWSLLPLSDTSATVEIERETVNAAAGKGSSLWVYLVEGEKRTAVREVTWAFEVEGEMEVGVYAARPTKTKDDAGEKLVVDFAGFIVE